MLRDFNAVSCRNTLVRMHDALCAKASQIAIARGIASEDVVDSGDGSFAVGIVFGKGVLVHLCNASSCTFFRVASPNKIGCVVAEDRVEG